MRGPTQGQRGTPGKGRPACPAGFCNHISSPRDPRSAVLGSKTGLKGHNCKSQALTAKAQASPSHPHEWPDPRNWCHRVREQLPGPRKATGPAAKCRLQGWGHRQKRGQCPSAELWHLENERHTYNATSCREQASKYRHDGGSPQPRGPLPFHSPSFLISCARSSLFSGT